MEDGRLSELWWLAIWFVAPACGISTNERCLRIVQSTRAISHAQSLEPNRVINRDRCRDGRLVLALVQGSGTSTRILTAPHLSKVNPLSFARECTPLPSRQKTGGAAACHHAKGKKNCGRTSCDSPCGSGPGHRPVACRATDADFPAGRQLARNLQS
jgi:hypothetical protein